MCVCIFFKCIRELCESNELINFHIIHLSIRTISFCHFSFWRASFALLRFGFGGRKRVHISRWQRSQSAICQNWWICIRVGMELRIENGLTFVCFVFSCATAAHALTFGKIRSGSLGTHSSCVFHFAFPFDCLVLFMGNGWTRNAPTNRKVMESIEKLQIRSEKNTDCNRVTNQPVNPASATFYILLRLYYIFYKN